MEKTLAVHKIRVGDDPTFDTNLYSKFKYGSTEAANRMAIEMVKVFVEHDTKYNIIDIDTKVCIASPAHKRVPSAANKLADDIYLMLNWYLHNKGYEASEQLRVYREAIYEEDYATLSAINRQRLLSTERLSVNEEKIRDKFVIFIDDIRVTGTHEKLVEDMVKTYPHSGHIHLYYAECEEGVDPNIENTLNKGCVRDYNDIIEVLGGEHILNARMIKDILRMSAGEITQFREAYRRRTSSIGFFVNLVNSCIAEGYDKIPSFRQNFIYLKNIVKHEFNKPKETACNQS